MLDLTDSVTDNIKKLAKEIAKQYTHACPDEIIEEVLLNVFGNALIDEELEENILIGLAKRYEVTVENVQHDFNS